MNYFLALINRSDKILTERLIWVGAPGGLTASQLTHRGWQRYSDVEEEGFEVPRMTRPQAEVVKKRLEQAGMCGDLAVKIQEDKDRWVWVLFQDDGNKWVPHAKVVTELRYDAITKFKTLLGSAGAPGLVDHLSGPYCRDWQEVIAEMEFSEPE